MNATTNTNSAYRSNILGATGLPKAILAGMFLRDGLFGRESSLSREEQAVVQSRLPAIRGLVPPAMVKQLTPRLVVLADLAKVLVEGADASAEQVRALRAGFGADAVSEVQTVIANVFAVFGPFPAEVRTARSNDLPWAVAA